MTLINVFQQFADKIDERRKLKNFVRRMRKTPDRVRILPRNQLVELIKFSIYVRELMEAKEALHQAIDRHSMDLQEQLDYFKQFLRPDRRAPDVNEEENRTRNAESELDRWLNGLTPRQKSPGIFIVGPSDPRDALDGIASNGGSGDAPPEHVRIVRQGEITRVERSTTYANGTTQQITETWRSGELLGRVINVYDNRGRLIKEAREYLRPVEGNGRPEPTGTVAAWEHIPGHRFHYFWRFADEEKWHQGVAPGNPRDWPERGRPRPMRFPLDDASGGVPHFFLKLPNGGYAMCYVTSPTAGLSFCTLLSRDQVNIRDGVAPVIDAPHLNINPEDLVINPDPNNPLVQDLLTPEEVEHRFERPDPGGRPPVPDF